MCCVRAGQVAAGVAARRHIIRPEERVLITPVVDRSKKSPFHIIAFGATAVECPHQLKPSNRQKHILPGLESRGVDKRQPLGSTTLAVIRCGKRQSIRMVENLRYDKKQLLWQTHAVNIIG